MGPVPTMAGVFKGLTLTPPRRFQPRIPVSLWRSLAVYTTLCFRAVMFSIRLTRDFVVTARPPQPGLVLTLAQASGPSFLLPNVSYRFHQFYRRPSGGLEAEL